MNLNLTKVVLPGTWRYIGRGMAGHNTSNIPIAAKSAKALEDHFEGHCFQLGGRRITNVVVEYFFDNSHGELVRSELLGNELPQRCYERSIIEV